MHQYFLRNSTEGGAIKSRPAILFLWLCLFLAATPLLAQQVSWREAARNFEVGFSELGDKTLRRSSVHAILSHDRMEGVKILLDGLAFLEDTLEPQRIAYGELIRQLTPLQKDVLYPEQHEEKARLEAKRTELGLIIFDGEETERMIVKGLSETKNEKVMDKIMRMGLSHPHWIARSSSADALGFLGHTKALALLIKAMNDKDSRVRTAVVEALGSMRIEESEKSLIRILQKDESWQVRSAAIGALAKLGTKDCVEALIRAMEHEKGRLLGDITQKLRRLTGFKFIARFEPWRDWWETAKDTYKGTSILFRAPGPLPSMRDPALPPKSYSGIETYSDRIVFVFDISDSMNDASSTKIRSAAGTTDRKAPGRSKMHAGREELKSAIRSLTTKDYFNIVVYNHHVKKWQDKMMQANPSNKALALQFLNGLKASGGTNIFDALEISFNLGGFGAYDRHYKSSVDTIFLLSDGAPSHGRITNTDQILAEVARMNKLGQIKIHTVAMGHLAAREFLKKLAKDNNGESIERY